MRCKSFIGAVALALTTTGYAATHKNQADQSVAPEMVPGELIVKLKAGNTTKDLKSLKSIGIRIDRQLNLKHGTLYVVKYDESQKSFSMAQDALTSSDIVEYAEPNYIYRVGNPQETLSSYGLVPHAAPQFAPNDPRFGQLWGLVNTGTNEPRKMTTPGHTGVAGADVDALRAWEITKGSRDIRVAVIDTGIDYNHPDLKDNMWVNQAELNGEEGVDDDGNGYIDDVHGYDFANNDSDPWDGHSHGTHCAGTIGAVHDNGEGVAGVMADVELVAVKFLGDNGSGTTEGAIRSIDYATSLNVDIMSNSWGGGGFSQALKDSIQHASDEGIVFVAAAGNSSSNNDRRPHYPSNYDTPNMVSVAAHTINDDLAYFSCYGARTVHVAAPGHKIMSTVKNGGYKAYSGTSMATPHVSGVIGLLLSQEGRMDHAEFRERLLATTVPVQSYRRKTISGGRVNAYNLLTDTRPERNEPDPSQWERMELDEVIESSHPYEVNANVTETITVPGAKFVRLVVEKYELENNYDFLSVMNPVSNQVVDKISGVGSGYSSEYVEGDTLKVKFTSDRSVVKWGYKISHVEYIR